jgi:hypothetical protein
MTASRPPPPHADDVGPAKPVGPPDNDDNDDNDGKDGKDDKDDELDSFRRQAFVKLCDFGLAKKIVGMNTHTMTACLVLTLNP